ncbi:aspartate aminotransferase family protein [Kribbella sp. CA-253562]|uniref:class-III pyridoxal-phosphate-dependent aminotransferase n=1 Tax=Kribbella sp. CA-253562 TaxID=3239942 RepID=UPI003D92775E
MSTRSVVRMGGGTPAVDISHGRGLYVWDVDDRRYIDCTSQSWASYLGHANPELAAQIVRQTERLWHAHQGFGTREREKFAHDLLRLVPGNDDYTVYDKVSFTATSALAIETAIKLAVLHGNGRKTIARLTGSFHGTTLGVAPLSWPANAEVSPERRTLAAFAGLGVPSFTLTFPIESEPRSEQLDQLEAELSSHRSELLAVIVEPIQGSGGQRTVPDWWLSHLSQLAREIGIYVIYDEIQTYMRPGRYLTDVERHLPDFICLGKGLAGGLACGAVLARRGSESFPTGGVYDLHTFASSPLSHSVGSKLIEIVERDSILENARERGSQLRDGLKHIAASHPEVVEVRQVGLHIGIEIDRTAGRSAADLRVRAMSNGLLVGLGGFAPDVLKIKPPLNITATQADEVLEHLQMTFASA